LAAAACRNAQRQLTVTFVDLIGSMALSGRLDLAHVRDVMHVLSNTAISLSSTAIAPVGLRSPIDKVFHFGDIAAKGRIAAAAPTLCRRAWH
jgi:hypothetical protein